MTPLIPEALRVCDEHYNDGRERRNHMVKDILGTALIAVVFASMFVWGWSS